MSIPSSIGLPEEMQLGSLNYSIPPDAKSMNVKIQPSNLSFVTASYTPPITATTAFQDIPFVTQNIIFDIPCGQSPSTFMDNRFTCLNFQLTVACTNLNGGSGGTFSDAYLRSGAYSFFDRMYITNQAGSILEDISEWGLTNDLLCGLMMNNSTRHGVATQYGFDTNYTQVASQGHAINCLSSGIAASAYTTNLNETHSYSIPLLSGVVGCLADKFLNIGRTSKLQLVLQTSQLLPISGGVNAAFTTSAPTFSFTLSNMSLQCKYVDIGINALQLLDSTLVDGKTYIHGTTYRTSSATIPAATSGTQTLLAGIRGSSVKSLFCRFAQGGTLVTGTTITGAASHGKYDSFNPMISSINYNVGGVRYPQMPINPLLSPSQSFVETQQAIGSFNNAQFQSSIPPSAYCRLSAGGTASGTGVTNTRGQTQEFNWNLSGVSNRQAQFFFGSDLEVVAKRGLLSGLNCTSAPIFVEMNIATAPTNSHTCYVHAYLDMVLIHDIKSGDIQVRI